MSLPTIDIVMFNMSSYVDWQNGIENRNFHILHNLLLSGRVRKIMAVDYLPFTFKRALRGWWQNIVGGVEGQVMARGFGYKLTALRADEIEKTGYKLPGVDGSAVTFCLFVYSDITAWWSEKKVYQRLQSQLSRLGFENLVVWSYLPTAVGYLTELKAKAIVFDAVDNWLEHSSYKKIRERLKLNYQTIKYRADMIFTTAENLVKFFDRQINCEFVPNGVNLENFVDPPKLIGRDILHLPHPTIGYIGTIQEDRIDLDLVRYLADKNPTKSIVMAGPVWKTFAGEVKSKLGHLKNVYLLGRIKYQEWAAYFMNFDVGIIPHKVNEFTRHTDTMKLYQYLACGKPIVSTTTGGAEKFADYVYLADTPAEFNDAVIKALQAGPKGNLKKQKTLLQGHTWQKRAQYMLDRLEVVLK